MKTSNIFIIAFATFILAGMLILFVDAKQHKKNEVKNLTYKEYPLSAFSVVVAEKGSDVHVDQSDSTFIKVEYNKKKPTPAKLYELRSDTLFVYGGLRTFVKSKLYELRSDTLFVYGGLRTFVKCPNISAVVGNKPFWVGVNNFTPDTMTIIMNGGILYTNTFGYNERKISKKLVNMGIIANDTAYLNIKNLQLKNVSLALNNAKIDIDCPVKYASVKLENHARVYCFDNFENLTVQKDTSCIIRVDKLQYSR